MFFSFFNDCLCLPTRVLRCRFLTWSITWGLAVLPGLLLCFPASAQSSDDKEPLTVVITTARTPIPFDSALADLTVIDEQAIARSSAATLSDLLNRQPGIEIARYGGPGTASGLFLRGTNSGHALVLIDGVRTASMSTGTSSLETIPLADIERIEILRGAASMLYGADALGGVIQIFTKKASSKPLSMNTDVACGTYSTCTGNARVSGSQGLFRWAVGLGGAYSNGFNIITNPDNSSYNPDRDGYRNDYQRASLEFVPNENHNITLAYLRDAIDAQIDVSPTDDDKTRTQLFQTRLSGSHALTRLWKTRWQLSEMRNDSQTLSFSDTHRYRSRERQYLLQNEFDLAAWISDSSFLLALERSEQHLDSTTDYDKNTRNTDSITGSYRWQRNDHSLQLSSRHDRSTQYGGETNGGVSYGYRISPNWQFTSSIASAFKAPTFNDLYFPGYSNPDLAPERGLSIEAGLRHKLRVGELRGEWSATVWGNRVRDLIVYTCHNTGQCRPENIDHAKLRGVTLAADFKFRSFGVAGSIDRQSAKNDETGYRLPRRAQTHGTLTVSNTVDSFYSAINLVASGDRFDDAANTVRLGSYSVVNLVAEWKTPLSDTSVLTWFARLNNAFNKKYQHIADFSTGGREFLIGFRGKW